jgi:hypothetical protein
MRAAILCCSAALLASCINPGQFDRGLQGLVGKDIHAAFSRLGYPASQRVIAGDTVYTWSSSRHAEVALPTSSTTTGTVGGDPFYATTTGHETTHLHFHCTVELITGADAVIKHFQWEGGDCAHYARMLSR